jgi:hypothetical protein
VIWATEFLPFPIVCGMTVEQLDSAIESCRRVEAGRLITQARIDFFASQASGKELEKMLESFHELLEVEKENQLGKFLQLFAKNSA